MIAIENLFVKYIQLREKLDKGKIYKIVDKTNDNLYIGSTCQTLKRRLTSHKCHYERFLRGLTTNLKSFDIIKNDNYEIELLETCEVNTKSELLARERYFIENNECINKVIPGRTQKEWHDANKKHKSEYNKAHYIENKEQIKKKREEKFECECGGCYTLRNKARHIKTTIHQKFLNNL